MFGSNVLEVAIGVGFVYTFLSLLCSTINEQVIARFLALRAKTLEDGINNMLADPALVKQLYDNPFIKGLSQHAASSKPRKPSYIPADLFTLALMSTDVIQAYKNNPSAANSLVPEALASLIKMVEIDPAKGLASIEKWYNDTMERVSGWYTRRVQLIIFALGLVITVGLNIDTFSLITNLSNNTVTQAALVSAAQGFASSPSNAGLAALQHSFAQIQPVIGWSASALPTDFWGWVLKIVGLLATTVAVSLGAPFWFDVLNRFVTFRSSGSPPQTSTGTSGSTGTPLQVVAGAKVSPNTSSAGSQHE